ncbi:hypothetical protein MPSEU_001062200 [Mayamaea pseudoterrestris]|nr:hypothetical protein MPSEU_001062200 [Mayamaea pseudoterrestris]
MYPQRGPPPMPGDRSSSEYYQRGPPPSAMPRSSQSSVNAASQTKADGIVDDRPPPPPPQPYPGWSSHAPQWHNSSYGPPPHGWQGPGGGASQSSQYSPQHMPPGPSSASGPLHPAATGPSAGGHWGGSSSRSPPRSGGSSRMRHDAPYGRPELDMSYMTSRSVGGIMDDEMEGSSTGGSTKDKGRGSYKCGRCGVPKKGHVCPYQPKLKRRPDEPTPETRNAAIQVEMDEFMTLRRLNLKIQGLPASYAVEPFSNETCMVVGEPAHHGPSSMYPDGMLRHSMSSGVDHLQPIAPALPSNDAVMSMYASQHQPHVTGSTPLPLDDDLTDPNLNSAPSPLPPDLPRSSPAPEPMSSKDVAVGDDAPIDDDTPLAIDEEKKE